MVGQGNGLGKGGGEAYERSADGDDAALVAGLHDGCVDTFDGIGKGVEIAGQELVEGEVFAEDVEELH